MTEAATRICTRCRECHPVEFFNRDKTRPDGVYPQCKNCSRAACKRVYGKYYDKHVAAKRAWKAENPERHKEINRHWQQANPQRVAAATARWRAKNPEKALQWAKENPERVREILRKHKLANRDKIREVERRYHVNNRGRVRAKNARRRAVQLSATPKWADHEMLAFIYSECPDGWHVDHVYPLKGRNSCGLHVQNNLQYLRASDNCSKSNKVPVAQEAWSDL